jgi:hypothetical protein
LLSQNKRTKQKAALKAPCGFIAFLRKNGDKGNSLRSNNLHPNPFFPAILIAFKGEIITPPPFRHFFNSSDVYQIPFKQADPRRKLTIKILVV